MSNSRFSLTNYAPGATIVNGAGGGVPVRDESSPFVMERALNADRRSLWKSGGSGGTLNVDLNLGSAKPVQYVGLHGYRAGAGGTVSACTVSWNSVDPGGTWVPVAVIPLSSSPRDGGIVLPGGNVSAQYWRFSFPVAAAPWKFTLGHFWLGPVLDAGRVHSPDGQSNPFRNRLEQTQQDGSIVINELGDNGRDFTLPFNTLQTADRLTLEALSDVSGSLIHIDADDRAFECILRAGRVTIGRKFVDNFDVGIEMARLA